MGGKKIDRFREAAEAYQRAVVIPHCTSCKKPCCKLDELVLELSWKTTQKLYKITTTRRDFDQRLADGEGPPDLKESHGTYYAHGQPCRGYDVEKQTCTIYNTDYKPEGCSEFPVYVDGDAITADLRCEATNADELQAHLEKTFGRKVRRTVDHQYAFFVTYEIERQK